MLITGTYENYHVKAKILFFNKFISTYHHLSNCSSLIVIILDSAYSVTSSIQSVRVSILWNLSQNTLKSFCFCCYCHYCHSRQHYISPREPQYPPNWSPYHWCDSSHIILLYSSESRISEM